MHFLCIDSAHSSSSGTLWMYSKYYKYLSVNSAWMETNGKTVRDGDSQIVSRYASIFQRQKLTELGQSNNALSPHTFAPQTPLKKMILYISLHSFSIFYKFYEIWRFQNIPFVACHDAFFSFPIFKMISTH